MDIPVLGVSSGKILSVWTVDRYTIETCATIFWERAERETSWKTCGYYVENSNIGTSLILLVVVGIGVLTHTSIRPIHQWAQPTHQSDGYNNILI